MTLFHKLLVLTYLAFLFGACSDQKKQIAGKAVDNLYSTNTDDQPMNKAMEVARRKFTKFDSAFESGRFDRDKFSIKVKFPHPRGNEYIWLTEISKQGSNYWGVITDTPRMTTQVKMGDRVKINERDIADWLYGKDSILHGGFTLRLIHSRMTKEENAEENASFPYKIED